MRLSVIFGIMGGSNLAKEKREGKRKNKSVRSCRPSFSASRWRQESGKKKKGGGESPSTFLPCPLVYYRGETLGIEGEKGREKKGEGGDQLPFASLCRPVKADGKVGKGRGEKKKKRGAPIFCFNCPVFRYPRKKKKRKKEREKGKTDTLTFAVLLFLFRPCPGGLRKTRKGGEEERGRSCNPLKEKGKKKKKREGGGVKSEICVFSFHFQFVSCPDGGGAGWGEKKKKERKKGRKMRRAAPYYHQPAVNGLKRERKRGGKTGPASGPFSPIKKGEGSYFYPLVAEG